MPIPNEQAGPDPELWLPGKAGNCMICGCLCEWAYLSFGYLHPECVDREVLDSPAE